MRKNDTSVLSAVFLTGILFWIYFSIMPRWGADDEVPLSGFSTKRALEHVRQISQNPHFTGSENHVEVATYIQKELHALGLETQVQQGTTLSDWGNLVKSKNILARIKGTSNGKALLLLSHYDSAPHSDSHGASDDAAGIATILEGIRAFQHSKKAHSNDIIILFTDAEELGLNGAALFVTQHPWAKETGLALNFEARGTSGPSYMLMEVGQGNAKMVDGFANASPDFPVSNSLMYSIYKMLPNDTDLTVFREQGKIPGFNFAFIDNHFNYHTAQDDVAHLSHETLAHQGTYLMPLLQHFSNSDLSHVDAPGDQVYFNTPVGFFHYPFSWTFPLLAVAFLFFIFLIFIGIGKRLLNFRDIGKGFILFLLSIAVAGLLTFFGWKILLAIYPEYADILQGFTYNGHSYIAGFVLLSMSVGFIFYFSAKTEAAVANYTVAPLLIWLVINLLIAIFLPGAGFFIIPVFFALLMFGWFVFSQGSSNIANTILAVPAIFILAPFIVMFPIGLGLKILAGSAVLTLLVFGLLLPVFASYRRKWLWSLLFFLAAVGCFIHAHINSGYASGKARPNSLLYVYNTDTDKAFWATYDKELDEWTKTYMTEKLSDGRELLPYPLFSKYNTTFRHTSEALVRDIPEPSVEYLMDTIVGTYRHLRIKITPNRKVNRYDIFANEKARLHNLKGNGAQALGQKGSLYPRNGKKIISYYVVDNEPLELQFSISKDDDPELALLESSFDLMTNPLFRMSKRADWMMPMPFVLNDAIVLIKKIRPAPKVSIPVPVQKNFVLPSATNDTIPDLDEEM
ncbi:MAG TPA: M20/M25/M40 family metallo-hydrolase [Flavobacterium sp.]|jgi:hypothetical protein